MAKRRQANNPQSMGNRMHVMMLLHLVCVHVYMQLLTAFPTVEAACSHPYTAYDSFCLHVEKVNKQDWCGAQDYCRMIGGRLMVGNDKINALIGKIPYDVERYLIGATDLLHERGRSNTGWLFTDGSEVMSTTSKWLSKSDNTRNTGPFDDCMTFKKNMLRDMHCIKADNFICEPYSPRKKQSVQYKQVTFPNHGYTSVYYCKKVLENMRSELECAAHCQKTDSCLVFLFNNKTKKCVLLRHTDASVEAEIEANADWKKFKML